MCSMDFVTSWVEASRRSLHSAKFGSHKPCHSRDITSNISHYPAIPRHQRTFQLYGRKLLTAHPILPSLVAIAHHQQLPFSFAGQCTPVLNLK